MRNITTSPKKGEHLIGGFLLIDKLCSVLLRGSYFVCFFIFLSLFNQK